MNNLLKRLSAGLTFALLAFFASASSYAGLINISGGARTEAASSGSFVFDSGWTGTVPDSQGEAYTVTRAAGGLDFPTDARPLLWIPAESGFGRDATYSRTSQTMTAANNATHQATIKPVNAAGAIRQDWPISGDAHLFFGNDPVWSFTGPYNYVFLKRYVTFPMVSGLDPNNKAYRLWEVDASSGTPDTYFSEKGSAQIAVTEGLDLFTQVSDEQRYHNMEYFPEDEWTTDEYFFLESSVDVLDGIINFCRNGLWAFVQAKRWMTRDTALPQAKGGGYLNQFSNILNDLNGESMYLSGLYIDDKWARLMISQETTWNTSIMSAGTGTTYKREIQIVVSGSDTQAAGDSLRFGEFSSVSTLCLWAINNSNTARRVGCWP